ncbi:MAG: hypothetical protein GQ542_00830 [Desulforhopalus sp.]|nr:hypothetical protein [Desulforhopalus sp.]
MSSRRKSKKRPCRICQKWFMPHPRVGDRQKTCGDHECMRKWHARKCAEWNRKNRNCAQEKYLSDRLALGDNEQEGTKGTSAASHYTEAPCFRLQSCSISATTPISYSRGDRGTRVCNYRIYSTTTLQVSSRGDQRTTF